MADPASIKPPDLNELSRPPILCKGVVLFKLIIMKLLSNPYIRLYPSCPSAILESGQTIFTKDCAKTVLEYTQKS